MKYLSIILLVSLNITNDGNCKLFREGKFVLSSADGTEHKIARTKDEQIEEVPSKGFQSHYELKWIDECTYILFNRTVVKGVDEYPKYNKGTLYNHITPISDTKCKITSWFKGSQKIEVELTKQNSLAV